MSDNVKPNNNYYKYTYLSENPNSTQDGNNSKSHTSMAAHVGDDQSRLRNETILAGVNQMHSNSSNLAEETSIGQPVMNSTQIRQQIFHKEAQHGSDSFHSAVSANFTQTNPSLAEITADDLQTLTLGTKPRAAQSQTPYADGNHQLVKELEKYKAMYAQLKSERDELAKADRHHKLDRKMYLETIEKYELDKQRSEEAIRNTALQKEAMQKSLNAVELENNELRKKCTQLEEQLAQQAKMDIGTSSRQESMQRPKNNEHQNESSSSAEKLDESAILIDLDSTSTDEDSVEGNEKNDDPDFQESDDELSASEDQTETIIRTVNTMRRMELYYHCNRYQRRPHCEYKLLSIQSEDRSFKVYKKGDHNHIVVPLRSQAPRKWILMQTVPNTDELEKLRQAQRVHVLKASSNKKCTFRCYRYKQDKCPYQMLAVTENDGKISIFQSGKHDHEVQN